MIILLTVFLHLTAQVWHVSGKLYIQLAVLKLFGISGIPTKVTRYYPLVTLADARDVTYFKLRALSLHHTITVALNTIRNTDKY